MDNEQKSYYGEQPWTKGFHWLIINDKIKDWHLERLKYDFFWKGHHN